MSDIPYTTELNVPNEDGDNEKWEIKFRRLSLKAEIEISKLGGEVGTDAKITKIYLKHLFRDIRRDGTKIADWLDIPSDIIKMAVESHPSTFQAEDSE